MGVSTRVHRVARVLDLTPVCTYFEETKHASSYNLKTFVDSFVVTSLNMQRLLSAGEVSGLRRCRPHVAAVAGKWGRPHILDLCSFPSLSSIQIHRIELSCCLPFFQHLLFESKLWVHTVVHCYTLSFTFCCMFCINLLSLYDSSLSLI